MDVHIFRDRRSVNVYLDSTREERIALVKNLYMRPGTPGEKAAAAEALRRMGISENDPIFRSPRQETSQSPRKEAPRTKGPWRYEIILKYEVVNKGITRVIYFGPEIVEAFDGIEAEGKVREHFRKTWRSTTSGRVPEARVSSTRRMP